MRKNIFKKVLIIVILIFFAQAINLNGNSKLMTADYKSYQNLARGDPYFIMLSEYTDGAGDDNKWALQLRFDSDLNVVESEYDNKSLPLITNEWVEIRINIDLTFDWLEIYYDDDLLIQKEWSAGPDNQGEGIVNISAVNLFSDSTTSVYFDDFSLEEVGGGIIWSENFDSYEDGSSIHGQGGWKGWDNDSDFTAYVTSIKNRSSPHSLDIKAGSDIVHEYFGNYSGEFVYIAWIYFPENIAPLAPNITGPENGTAGSYYEYNFTTTDYNQDDIFYYIDWGDGNIENWIGPYTSGEIVEIGHVWSEPGIYEIRAKAKDTSGAESNWSEPYTIIIENQQPNPPIINGPIGGKKGISYIFNFVSYDSNGDDLKYYIDWGDGSSNITGYEAQGTNVPVAHTWAKDGVYTITAYAQDVYGADGPESTKTFKVTRNKSVKNQIFLHFFEQFPLLEKLFFNRFGL